MDKPINSRIENLKKYLSEDPKDSFLRYALAMELYKNKEISESRKIFKDLILEYPEYLASYYQYGKLLEENQQSDEAIKIYGEGIKIAEKQNNIRTVKELKEALYSLLDIDE